ncbi:endonuclease/exonuclease/phosphatase family protein [Streptosporangium sp. NPDC006930]|uniref:endonuclease/exonuclease/phosphatase family protein n=1 Tax=Streptosporangium sp. NPDC006930 TaxID=3154783 RepID=UPI003418480B
MLRRIVTIIVSALFTVVPMAVVSQVAPAAAQSQDRVIISGDWDGDGTDTYGIVDTSTNPMTWYLTDRYDNFWVDNLVPDTVFTYGDRGATPIVGDWNNDDIDTPGVFVSTGGTPSWRLRNSNTSGSANVTFGYGAASDTQPLVGDWDKDGDDTPGLFRPGSPNTYLLRNNNTAGSADLTFTYGSGAGKPIAGDWNNDGRDTIGFVNTATSPFTWQLRNTNNAGSANVTFTYGSGSASSVFFATGDWDGNGSDTPAVALPLTNGPFQWHLRNSNTSGVATSGVRFNPVTPLKLMHFNLSGGILNNGTYPIIGRIVREVQARRPDVISLNEICDRQYAHLVDQLAAAGYAMQGYFQESRTFVPDCIVFPDTRNEAGNAILVRAEVTQQKGYMFTSDHKLEERDQPVVTEERSVACVVANFPPANQSVKACSTHLADGDASGAQAETRELTRVFGPEANSRPFILMGDLNLTPDDAAIGTLYYPAGSGNFWETDTYWSSCIGEDGMCEPVRGGRPTRVGGNRKIDYTFLSRDHFSVPIAGVDIVDAGNCDTHPCSDHLIIHSSVDLYLPRKAP